MFQRGSQAFLLIAITLLTVGCGSSRESFVFTNTAPSSPPSLSGTISYQKLSPIGSIGPDEGGYGTTRLDFARPVTMPCRFVRVQLLDLDNQVLAESHTNSEGLYTFQAPPNQDVKIRVFAESVRVEGESASIRVQDNTNNDAPYAAESDPVNPLEVAVVNIDLPTGYDANGSQAPDMVRSSAPFACLDGILTGYRYFLAGGLDDSDLPLCIVNWSEQNRPAEPAEDETTEQALADGKIGTSFFTSEVNQLFILGFREADTDEFDWHIMIHEFGHWVQFNAFRDNSFGGSHSDGEIKDPRLAFSEGFGNALGALALSDAVYKDTDAMEGFCFSLECNLSQVTDPNPGWFSENSIGTILFDLFDPKRQEGGDSNFNDQIELSLNHFIEALSNQSKSKSLTTIFSFLDGLVESGLSQEDLANLVTLLAFQSPNQDFGLNSLDAFAAGETHSAGLDSLPLYLDVNAWVDAGDVLLTLPGQPEEGVYNSLQGTRYLFFSGDGTQISVTARNSTSVVGAMALALFEDGRLISEKVDDDSEEDVDNDRDDSVVTHLTKQGSTYVVVVINTSTDTSTTAISITR